MKASILDLRYRMKDVIKAFNTLEAVFKQNATDFVDERGQIQMQQLTSTIVKKQ